ncbi:MAG: NAD(P)/FAD-dependent oxidoreductase [Myxococcota bacterium]|nr:NAD(P)/FAD-dependent oxidoreductase [Myxococcota bacterium]MEC9443169.1 NAD(P)/FAD-dependent oxidoreductase [Myxococcota bacterium]
MSEKRWDKHVAVIGAGPVGCTLAAVLARRGFAVELFEKRADMRRDEVDAGRSINLVLTNRGLRALGLLGVRDEVLETLTVPVYGRMMHATDGALTYQPYGKDDSECNYSISRGELNKYVITMAEKAGVTLHFEHDLIDGAIEDGNLIFETPDGQVTRAFDAVFGADGAPSGLRRILVEKHDFEQRIEWLDHGYKEIPFPAANDGGYAMEKGALHIWPRGHHMLMGLANMDGSFTGTIYLPNSGEDSFEQLDTPEEAEAFFNKEYPDTLELVPGIGEAFLEHPVGTLGTLWCRPWHLGARALLVGDAAHAIVPFFGQGCNCGLEDCLVLDELLGEYDDLEEVFAMFDASRKPNGDAIAQMALENFIEMRDRVGDAEFLLRKKVEHRIEVEYPELYRSRYATVMYSAIPYKFALDAGEIQRRILTELTEDIDSAEELDMERARQMIEQELTPFYQKREIDLGF